MLRLAHRCRHGHRKPGHGLGCVPDRALPQRMVEHPQTRPGLTSRRGREATSPRRHPSSQSQMPNTLHTPGQRACTGRGERTDRTATAPACGQPSGTDPGRQPRRPALLNPPAPDQPTRAGEGKGRHRHIKTPGPASKLGRLQHLSVAAKEPAPHHNPPATAPDPTLPLTPLSLPPEPQPNPTRWPPRNDQPQILPANFGHKSLLPHTTTVGDLVGTDHGYRPLP